MTSTPPPPSDWPLQRRAKWLRVFAILIFTISLAVIAFVYWSHRSDQPLPDDITDASNSKIITRQIEMNSGKVGLFLTTLTNDLHDPDILALTIFISATVVAGFCLYLAHLLDRDINSSESFLPRD